MSTRILLRHMHIPFAQQDRASLHHSSFPSRSLQSSHVRSLARIAALWGSSLGVLNGTKLQQRASSNTKEFPYLSLLKLHVLGFNEVLHFRHQELHVDANFNSDKRSRFCRLHTRPLSSSTSASQRPRGRVPLEERKAMVESYVKTYREKNGGDFPSASQVVKQVGGSFYVIRRIVQELQAKAKLFAGETVHAKLRGDKESSTRDSALQEEKVLLDQEMHVVESHDNGGSTSYIKSEVSMSKDNIRDEQIYESEARFESEGIGTASAEDARSDIHSNHNLKASLDSNQPTRESDQTQTIEESMESTMSNASNEEPNKSTLWGYLRSFTSNFVRVWKH